MIIDLNELNIKEEIEFNYEVLKDDNLDKRIIDLKNASVNGIIYNNSNNEIELDCEFNGTMIIEDSISLESIPYDFNVKINENINEIAENYDNCYNISQNTLDLKGILWQNIVLEVPITYSKVHDAKLSGNGWEFKNSETKNEEIDPRLKKLEDLLKGDD